MKVGLSDLSIIITSIIVLISIALTFQTEFVWIAQDFAAIPSLFYLLVVVFIGAIIVGRRQLNPKGVNLYAVHRKFGVFFTALILITLMIGIWGQIFHGEMFFWEDTELSIPVIHGWSGLVIAISALLQVIPSLIIKDRRKIRRFHAVLGYITLVLLIIQILLGVGAALMVFAGD